MTKSHPTQPLPLKVNMLWNSAGSLVYFGFQWLLTVVVVRISGDYEAAGVLALAMTVYNIMSPISVYRMFTYQISDVAHENTLGEYLSFRLVTTALAMVIAIVYTALTCPLTSFLPIMLYLVYKMLSQFIDSLHATMQLNSRMDYIGKSYAMQGVGSFVAFCAIFYCSRSLELSFAGMACVVVMIGWFYDRPRALCFEPIKLGISKSKVRHLLIYCFPIVIAAIACSISPSVPRQYLAMTQGEALLGAYASVAAPAAVIQMGASYVYTPLLSTLAEQHLNKDARGFSHLLIKASAAIVVVGVVSAVLLVAVGDWLLTFLFGPSIAEYAYLLLPVIGCTFAAAFLWFFNDLLIAIRQFGAAFAGNAVALVVTLISTVPFVDVFGPNGISFTNMAAYACGVIVLAFFLLRSARAMKRQSANDD